MVSFVSIMRLDDGLASYRVNESREFYRAELISATCGSVLPGELTISKPLHSCETSPDDKVMNKLMQAIRSASADPDFIN